MYLKNLEAGMRVWKDEKHTLSIGVRYFGMSFRPGDTGNAQLKRLDKRRSTLMATASYSYSLPYGMKIAVSGSQDVLGKSKGFVGDVAVSAPLLVKEKLMVFSDVGVKWSSGKVNDYYFGVSAKESVRSGLREYKAKSGFTPGVGVKAIYSINENWSALVGVKVEFLDKEVKNSPMVGKSVTTSVMAGILNRF